MSYEEVFRRLPFSRGMTPLVVRVVEFSVLCQHLTSVAYSSFIANTNSQSVRHTSVVRVSFTNCSTRGLRHRGERYRSDRTKKESLL